MMTSYIQVYTITYGRSTVSSPQNTPTPDKVVNQILDHLPADVWTDGKTFIDPECGTGQFLTAVAERKTILGHANALESIYGTDISPKRINECRANLLAICGDTVENRATVNNNIRCESIFQ